MTNLKALHRRYIGCVKRFLGDGWGGDRGITVTGAAWLSRYIEVERPKTLLEMGTGFSTLVLREAAARSGTTVFSAEHDPTWLGFVRGLVSTRPRLDQRHFCTVEQIKNRLARRERRFDAVFVDHGPTWKARLQDLGWCQSVLAPGGLVILDEPGIHPGQGHTTTTPGRPPPASSDWA